MSLQATSHSPLATDSDEVLVRVEGVSKKFCRSLKRSLWYGICDIGAELNPFRRQVAGVAGVSWSPRDPSRKLGCGFGVAGNGSKPDSPEPATSYSPPVTDEAGLRPGEFYAVRDVSFELRRGECLGLIGHNGAGKTTLLKMLNGLIKPDRGRIEMNGRVGALIALGAGFNPILTGRENIYINGSVLGLSKKEIDEKIDEIIDFAEIREFIDMPVQSYSSGMAVRLGFSVASSLSPDVLILDEVLAVGDVAFVVKCLNRLRDTASKAAVILVSHNMQAVAGLSTRVLLMQHGKPVIDTKNPVDALLLYYESLVQKVSVAGAGGARVLDCKIHSTVVHSHKVSPVIPHGAPGIIHLDFEVMEGAEPVELQINISDQSGAQILAVPILEAHKSRRLFPPGRHSLSVSAGSLELNPGKYFCTVTLRVPKNNKVLNRSEGLAPFRISDSYSYGAAIVRPALPTNWTCQSVDL